MRVPVSWLREYVDVPADAARLEQALVGLGWSAKDADSAVEAVAPEAGDDPQVAGLLRSALRTLSKA